jgi:hypothetical protein
MGLIHLLSPVIKPKREALCALRTPWKKNQNQPKLYLYSPSAHEIGDSSRIVTKESHADAVT